MKISPFFNRLEKCPKLGLSLVPFALLLLVGVRSLSPEIVPGNPENGALALSPVCGNLSHGREWYKCVSERKRGAGGQLGALRERAYCLATKIDAFRGRDKKV